jgi:hypothetical protein
MRFYDNRHTACTRLLENPAVPYNTVEHMMGHEVNSKTKRIYDHVRNVMLFAASESLASGHCEQRTETVAVPPQPSQWKESQPKPALDPDDVLAIMAEAQVGVCVGPGE